MAVYRTTVSSNREPERVFSYLADFSSALQWDPGVVEATHLGDGPATLGTRFRVVSRFLGRRVPLEYVITAFDRPRLVQLTAQNARLRSLDTITFVAVPTGTEVTYDATLVALGAWGVLNPLLGLLFRRVGERARAGLVRELNR